jgi:protein NDRG1
MPEIASELVLILDHFKIPQVICFGEGAGANICARFGMNNPNRCLGVALIHPSGSTNGAFSSLVDAFKEKLSTLRASKQNPAVISSSTEAYLTFHKFGNSNADAVKPNIKEFQRSLHQARNAKNLTLFVESFLK